MDSLWPRIPFTESLHLNAQVFRPRRIFVGEGPEKTHDQNTSPHHRFHLQRRPDGSCGRAVGGLAERDTVVHGMECTEADRGRSWRRERPRRAPPLRVVDGTDTRCGAGGRRGEAVTRSRPWGVGARDDRPSRFPTGATTRVVRGPTRILFTPEWGPGRTEGWGGRPAAAPSPSFWVCTVRSLTPVRLASPVSVMHGSASLGTGPAVPVPASGTQTARPA
jgi:hypothetical protein